MLGKIFIVSLFPFYYSYTFVLKVSVFSNSTRFHLGILLKFTKKEVSLVSTI